jgi:putative colanic acid biosynthesis acetyltransferase WcaF
MLITGNHDYTKVDFSLISKEIVVDDGVWIGAKAVVTGGVHIKTHAVLSALSLTSKNLDSYAIYQGNPALKVKSRTIIDTHI